MDARQVLIAAKALIPDEEHWWRGDDETRDDCHCPLTAFLKINATPPVESEAIRLLCEAVGLPGPLGCARIAKWNDAPERTLAEIHTGFDAAIALAGESA